MPLRFPIALTVLLTGCLAAPMAGLSAQATARDTALFAGGCFWCMEEAFDEVEGVLSTTSGYAGGDLPDPTYEQVTSGGTGHREAVRVIFDPSEVDYAELLEVFWRNVDPHDDGGQFCDRGFSYTAAIFARNATQAVRAHRSKERVRRLLGRDPVPPIVTGAPFYPAEEYHQNYHEENPIRYRFYKWNCGRERRLEQVWRR